jgi:hypothetical protein
MMLKTIAWPDGLFHSTFVLSRDEMLHLHEIGKAGPFAGKIYVNETSIAAVAPAHAVLATTVRAGYYSAFFPHNITEFVTSQGVLKFKDVMKGSKKDTFVFLRFEEGLTHLMRINCELPKDPGWDRVDMDHTFILQGKPVENRNLAYKDANVIQALANRADATINPDNELWALFERGNHGSPTQVAMQPRVLEELAETAKVCPGFVTFNFSHMDSAVLLVEFGGQSPNHYKHIFTEVRQHGQQMEQVPAL